VITFVAGDDIRRRFQLKNFDGSGAPDLTVTGTTVSAGILRKAKPEEHHEHHQDRTLIPLTAQVSTTPGAVWASGIVAVLFPVALTADLPHGEVLLEIQVMLAGVTKCSAIKPVWIERGL
jgi:hypothetical protein